METDFSRIQALVDRPGESLSVEIKRWIDPDRPQGQATIVKAALALRNHGGGYIVIGFDNETLQPDKNNVPSDVRALFHIDKIQGLVSRYASEPFAVAVEFPERDGQPYPVIVIPSGVKTPVAAKSDLRDGEETLIGTDSVYVRSLRANNTPSTTRATWKDWPKIVEVCFDNREADISRFLRRHLGSLRPEVVREFAALVSRMGGQEATTEDRLLQYLREGEERFQKARRERNAVLPKHGAWEVALLVVGEVPSHNANLGFLDLLRANNPRYTGWPVWLDSRPFADRSARPYVFQGTWEALVVSLEPRSRGYIDFMRLDPRGRFYLRRALEDDVSESHRIPAAMTVLDFALRVVRTAEAIAVGIAFAKAMGCAVEATQLAFAFRWTKLQGRQLTSWASWAWPLPYMNISRGCSAYQDEVLSFVTVPLDTPLSALGTFVHRAVRPLFMVFDDFELSSDVVEDLTRRLVERRL